VKKVLLIILTVTIAALMSVFGFACKAESAAGATVPETTAAETTATTETTAAETTMVEETTAAAEDDTNYVPQSVDDLMWKNISNFLTQFYLIDDLPNMTDEDKKFQFYAIDLNEDGQDEYFVLFTSPYFCGTGGCTMLLLDYYSEVITRFTVMEPPLYVSEETTNGWRDLLIYSEGSYRDLIFDGTIYPSNPSVATESSKEPDDSYEVLFDNDNYPAKTYYFYDSEDL
jgi:hypothetical protein